MRSDLSPCRSGWYFGDQPWRHELPLWAAPRFCDARHRLGERSEGVSPPGVPPEEMVAIPGTAVIKDGHLVPNDAPGFGIEVSKDWLEDVSV